MTCALKTSHVHTAHSTELYQIQRRARGLNGGTSGEEDGAAPQQDSRLPAPIGSTKRRDAGDEGRDRSKRSLPDRPQHRQEAGYR